MIARLTWRGVRSHWLRFVMTALAIVLGISFLTGSFVITDTIRAAFDDLFAQTTKGTDAVVRYRATVKSDFGDQRPPVSANLVARVDAVDGVRVAEGTIRVANTRILDREGKQIGGFAPQLGFNWSSVADLRPWRLAEGRAPRSAGEVVIDRGTALDAGYRPGDRVRILTQLPQRDYTIVGVTRFGRVDSPLGATAALFTTPQAQRIAGLEGRFDSIAVAADRGVTQQVLRARLQAAVGARGIEVVTGTELRDEQGREVRSNLRFFDIALSIFAAIGLLVGGFIIFNTFTIVVAQRTRELALIRAVGASPGQVFRSVLGESFLVGGAASAVGVGGGVALAAVLRAALDAIGVSLPGGSIIVRPRTVLLGLAVGLVVTLAAAVMPARRAGLTPPIAALRAVALEPSVRLGRRVAVGLVLVAAGIATMLVGLFVPDSGRLVLVLVGGGAAGLFSGVVVVAPSLVRPVARAVGAPLPRVRGTAGRLARDNVIRSPRRTARTAIALTVGVALVGFITIFGASAKKSIRKIFAGQLVADYVVNAGTGFGSMGFSPAVTRRIDALPETAAVTGLRFWEVRLRLPTGRLANRSVAALDPANVSRFLVAGKVQGDLDAIGAGIAISERGARKLGVPLGGKVRIRFGQDATDTSLPVVAIYEKTDLIGDLLISLDEFQRHVPLNLDFLAAVLVRPGVTPTDMARAIRPIQRDYPIIELQERREFVEAQAREIDNVVAFIYVLLALSVIIALLGIANTLALSIHERTHEIGLLRAVGMSRRQVRVSVRWEAVIIALLGTVIGLAIGLFFGWALAVSLRSEGFTEFDVAPRQLLVVVIVGAVAAISAAVVPAWRAGRMDVLDAIHTE